MLSLLESSLLQFTTMNPQPLLISPRRYAAKALKQLLADIFIIQFYLSESDVGKPRGPAAADKLAELNNYVAVSAHTGALDDAFLAKFHV